MLINDIHDVGYNAVHQTGCNPTDYTAAKELIASADVQMVACFDLSSKQVIVWAQNSETKKIVRHSLDLKSSLSQDSSETSLVITELLRAVFVGLKTTPQRERSPIVISPEIAMTREAEAQSSPSFVPRAETYSSSAPSDALSAPPKALIAPIDSEADGTPTKKAAESKSEQKEKSSRDEPPSKTDRASRRSQEVQATPPQEEHRSVLLEIQGGVIAASWEHPPTALLELGAHFPFSKIWGIDVFALAPLSPSKIEETEGTVSTWKTSLAAGLRMTFLEGASPVLLKVSAGIGLDATIVDAEANPGMKANTEASFAALFFGRLGGQWQLTRRISLVGEALLGTAVPRTTVTVVERNVATLSAFILCGMLGTTIKLNNVEPKSPQMKTKKSTLERED
jgi:hypothetical protein